MVINLRRGLFSILAVGLVTAGLTACGGIPTSGEVRAGDPFSEEEFTDFVFNPLGPTKDADQLGILQGFIAAFTGTQGDYATAREFLSKDFKKEWDPRQSVLIRTGAPSYRALDESTMEFSFTSKAQLDETGAYTAVPPAVQNLDYSFVKEDGQWRISQAPPGIVLAESTFLTIFSKHALYFYDLSLQYLVPDERWFPGGTTATRIVNALLDGPPEWLKGAVVSQFPDGTQLTPGTTVTVESTVAQVDLTSDAAAADARQRQLMQLQLSESLSSVSGIASVEVSIAGSVLSITPLGANAPISQRPVDSRPLVLSDGQFGYLSGGKVTELDGLGPKIVALQPEAVTVGVGASVAAVLNANGVSLVRKDGEPKLLDSRPGLIAPSIDDFGYVWTVPASTPNALLAFDFAGKSYPVSVSLPTDSVIRSLDVSQDDSRVVILLQSSSGPRLLVASIIRDPSQGFVPIGIGTPVLDTIVDADTALDAAWIDRFSVATLAAVPDEARVTSYEIGGVQTSLGKLANSTAIVGGNGRTGLRVLDSEGTMQSPRGSSWQASATDIDLIATQR